MLFTVYVTGEGSHYHAMTPDVPDCEATGTDLSQTLARVHLEIEAQIGQMLLAGKPLPSPRSLTEISHLPDYEHGGLYEIYVDDHQLAAMAVHQAGK